MNKVSFEFKRLPLLNTLFFQEVTNTDESEKRLNVRPLKFIKLVLDVGLVMVDSSYLFRCRCGGCLRRCQRNACPVFAAAAGRLHAPPPGGSQSSAASRL